MKILHVITGLDDGGAEAVLYRLCRADPGNEHRVVSLATEGKYGPLLEQAGVPVEAMGMTGVAGAVPAVRRLVAVLRRERPDAVQCWMYHANLVGGVAARIAGISQVFWGIHCADLEAVSASRGTRLTSWLCAQLSRRVSQRVVSCSSQACEYHVEKGYRKTGWIVIPNGVDLAQFTPDDGARARLREELGVDTGTRLIGTVARWDPCKDHENLLAALQRLAETDAFDWKCVLVGVGMTRGNADLVEAMTRRGLDERVILLGPRSDIPAVMNALDLHVLPSRHEAYPNVLIEAMACGTPCVATDVGDVATIVGDTGWIVPPEEPGPLHDALAEALGEMDDQDRWDSRRAACRRRAVAAFSIESMVDAYTAVWSDGDASGPEPAATRSPRRSAGSSVGASRA